VLSSTARSLMREFTLGPLSENRNEWSTTSTTTSTAQARCL